MKILVCIKPDMTGQEISPFDRLALEAALVLKETGGTSGHPDFEVDVITVGPARWKDCLYRALGTGADRAIHILTPDVPHPEFSGLVPAAAISQLLAGVINKWDKGEMGGYGKKLSGAGDPSPAQEPHHTENYRSYDLILTGIMSQDLMAGQTGPMLAQFLDLPCATAVTRLDIRGPGILFARREMEAGHQEDLDILLPALVSIQAGTYTPRYPVLSHMLKARGKPVLTLEGEVLPSVPEVFPDPVLPGQTREGRLVSGTVQEQVAVFREFLGERGLV